MIVPFAPIGDDPNRLAEPAPFAQAAWYETESRGTLMATVATDEAAGCRFLSVDLLIGWDHFLTCGLRAWSGERKQGEWWFSALNWCQTRLVFDLPDVAIDRVEFFIGRKPAGTAAFAIGPLTISRERPARLESPALPRGPIVDEMGQSRQARWANRTPTTAALIDRLREAAGQTAEWPDGWSKWGGDKALQFLASGHFRTHHDGERWWLVDPDGHAFWSAGADCVHPTIDHEAGFATRDMDLRAAFSWLPESEPEFAEAIGTNPWHATDREEMNFVIANFIRAFGPEHWREHWERQVLSDMRDMRFNTAGDWSDEAACRRHGFPYCRALELHLTFEQTPLLFRTLPDVYHSGLAADLARWAEQLGDTVADPAMIGYFMHNEPSWHFGDGHRSPAEEMLRLNVAGETRKKLVQFILRRHGDVGNAAAAWEIDLDLATLEAGTISEFNDAAITDLEDFSTQLLAHLIDAMSAACRAVDPHHLNLGVRWWTFPPIWALRAMGAVDVISFNYYQPKLDWVSYLRHERDPRATATLEALGRPVMVGEWHFGCLDSGLPSAALYATTTEAERAKAYRVYLEGAAANPWCVGVHWFNLYDRTIIYCPQSNENYHTGFLDITHRRHEAICDAARESHERLYAVARGDLPPYDEPVAYQFPSR